MHAEIPVANDIDVDAGLPEPGRYRPVEDLTCWARNIMGVGEDNWGDWPLLSSTYCGHTIGRTVRRRNSHVCLDLGTYATGRVALAEPSAGTVHIIEPDDE